MCDSLKADITALRRLSDATFSQMPVDVSEVLAGVAEKHKELQAQLEQQQGTFDAQLQEERDNSQQLLKKERAALQVQMQVWILSQPDRLNRLPVLSAWRSRLHRKHVVTVQRGVFDM